MGLLDQFGSLSDQAKQYALNALARFGNGVGDTVANIPGNAQKLAQGLLNLPQTAKQDLGGLLDGSMNGRIAQALSTPQQANPNQWLEQGMNLAGMAPVGGLMAHTVYHGSPHSFDKFDMSKIGTGEGAQAYGHGLYMAEEPAVANEYRRTLRNMNPSYDGIELNDTVRKTAAEILLKTKGDKAAAMKEAENYAFDNLLIPHIEKMDASKLSYGNLYKVDIPDEAIPRMLDWDKPLSEQAPEVQAAFAKMPRDPDVDLLQNMINQNATGGALVKSIAATKADDSFGKQYATDLMRQQGISGIRYLDGGSRGTGGTSNFVLFDDQLPRILEKNGVPTGLRPWIEDAKRNGLLK